MNPVELPGTFSFGTMSMTWTSSPPPTEQSIETLNYVLSKGITVINGGDFYGPDFSNLKLLQKFVETLSDDKKESLVISIKIGVDLQTFKTDGSRANIHKSIDNVLSYLGGSGSRPKLILEIARVDFEVPYDESIRAIGEYVDAGKIDGISVSEVGPKSINLAASTKYPISFAELELSIFTRDLISNGVLAELAKHGIPILAYSPLARGFLTDTTVEDSEKWLEAMGKGIQKHTERFNDENLPANMELAQQLYKYAHEVKNTSLESLATSWVAGLSGKSEYAGIKNLPKIIPNFSASTKEKVERNIKIIKLSDEDFAAIDKILEKYPVKGSRYRKEVESTLFA